MRTAGLAVGLALAAFALGCDTSQPFVTPARLDRGLVMVFTGIEGRSDFNREICQGLDAGGVEGAIELVDWTYPVPAMFLANLRAESRNRRKAEDLSQRILRYRMEYPERPVVLVGQSGGAAIAVWVAESLPAGVKVEGIILLAAALSPDYLLDVALYNSTRGLVNFYSRRDILFSAAGTTIAGTMEGAHTPSAGWGGFNVPAETIRPMLYRRLYQVGWNQSMEWTGHKGMHLTSGARDFVARYVAPLVLAQTWSEEVMTKLLEVPPTPPATAPGTTAPAVRPTTLPATAASVKAPPPAMEPVVWPIPPPATRPARPTSVRVVWPDGRIAEP